MAIKVDKTNKQKIGRGKELTELVKGSMEYTMSQMNEDFNKQFQQPNPNYPGMWCPYYIVDTFADYVVVGESGMMGEGRELDSSEYFKVGFTFDAKTSAYAFDTKDKWQVVELNYQPQSALNESRKVAKRKGGKKFEERVGSLRLDESQASNVDGPWKITGIGITADVINGNNRRYPASVLREAVDDLKTHLNESAGQGRLVLTGEPEHPSDKGTGRPTLTETVVRWNDVAFDGTHVLLEGLLLGTSAGKDIHAQMLGGVIPDISQRSRGDGHPVRIGTELVEDVDWCRINGYDLVANGWGSDPDGGVTLFESKNQNGDEEMTPEELMKMITDHPELFKDLLAGKTADEKIESVKKLNAEQFKTLDESIRTALGIDAKADVGKALQEAVQAKKELDEAKRKSAINTAIGEATKGLPYGEKLNKQFVEAVQASFDSAAFSGSAQDAEKAIKTFVESKRREYDGFAAEAKLRGMGFDVDVSGPVIENEIGVPAFAAGAHQFTESLIRRGSAQLFDPRKAKSRNELIAAQVLAMYDKKYQRHLLAESKVLTEAETASDLNLPYSVGRAILAAVWPNLIATSVFDVATTDQPAPLVYFEAYARESGVDETVSAEDVVASDPLGDYVDLAQSNLKPGTVVVTNVGAGITYDEFDDYVIDYFNGRLKALSTGDITAAQALKVNYGYMAIAKGENATIERGKMTMDSVVMTIVARRLAQQLTTEAEIFSRSQLGWDAQARTIDSLIKDITKQIDGGLFYLALASASSVASNSGGTWDKSSGKLEDLIRYIGIAKGLVEARFYTPTVITLSADMANQISTMVTDAGYFLGSGAMQSNLVKTDLNGFVTTIAGLPVFASTEHSNLRVVVQAKEIVAYRVYQPMHLEGPFPSYSSDKLVAAKQWYVEQFDGAVSPIEEKAAVVVLTA